MSRRRHKLEQLGPVDAHIESLSHEGRGVTRIEGKTVFVDGALPGEDVRFTYLRCSRKFDEGQVLEVLRPSPDRVAPRCEHYGQCGGCSLQHMAPDAQVQAKQRVLLDNLERIGRVRPEDVLPPLRGPEWGYRRKARLGARFVDKKGRVLVGFREKRKRYIAELRRCEVLPPAVGERLEEIAALVGSLSIPRDIPQIEVAAGDAAVALVFRHLKALSGGDRELLRQFGQAHGLHIHVQPGGPETVELLWPDECSLSYRLEEFDVELVFLPTDFTQVNIDINRQMVGRAVALLAPEPDDVVLDLFCGLGNFTLPLARRAGMVVGVEGDAGLLARAASNAQRNGIGNVEFHAADLNADLAREPWMKRAFSRVLLDPPRTGAQEIIGCLPALGCRRLVYVSCNTATLARDAGVLVAEHGFRLVSAGVMDMFPHTAHVESIALFERT